MLRHKDNRGFMLVITAFLIFFIFVAMVAFLNVATTDIQIMQNHKFSNKALYIAEAGIEDAISRLRQNRTWRRRAGNPLVVEFPSGSGHQYSVVCPQRNPPKIITSTATLANGYKRELEVSVQLFGSSAPYKAIINYWKEP